MAALHADPAAFQAHLSAGVALCPEASTTPPRPPGPPGEHTGRTAAPPVASPDPACKSLIAAIDGLQQQQARAEAARHAAEQAAAGAAAEGAGLKDELHAALRRAADLDDEEQAVQAALEARLQEQGTLAEQLRLLSRRLNVLRAGEPCCSSLSGMGAEAQHEQEMLHKKEIAEGLKQQLQARGVDAGTIERLCSDVEHSSVAGGGARGGQAGGAGATSWRKATWLGGGGAGAGTLLGSFSFRRRVTTAS